MTEGYIYIEDHPLDASDEFTRQRERVELIRSLSRFSREGVRSFHYPCNDWSQLRTTTLHEAWWSPRIIWQFIQLGANINYTTTQRNTLLMLVCNSCFGIVEYKTLRLLLENGANVNIKNICSEDAWIRLSRACVNPHMCMCRRYKLKSFVALYSKGARRLGDFQSLPDHIKDALRPLIALQVFCVATDLPRFRHRIRPPKDILPLLKSYLVSS